MKAAAMIALLAGTATMGLAGDLKEKTEVTAFGGGAWFSDGVGNKPIYGGSAGYGVTSKTLVYAEFSHSPLETGGPVGAHFIDAQGGIKQTLFTSDRVEPYALAGLGYGRFFVTGISGINSNYFGINVGGGARIFAGQRWGFQPEVRYAKYFDNGPHAVRYTGGIFFQW